jgi:hypothetical protein
VYGEPAAMAAVAERLDALPGARHVGLTDRGRGRPALVTADIRAEAADAALSILDGLGVRADDVALVRLDAIGPVSGHDEPLALVWADLLGKARIQARVTARYLVFMAAAGVIAAFGVIDESSILISGRWRSARTCFRSRRPARASSFVGGAWSGAGWEHLCWGLSSPARSRQSSRRS